MADPIVASSNSARLHVDSTGRFWRNAAGRAFDPVPEPLEPVASAVQIRAVSDWIAAISFRRDVGPRALLYSKLSDPVGVIGLAGAQHPDLGDELLGEIPAGLGKRRFAVEDATRAIRFCRSIVGVALNR
jgi:hypothetical protein